MDSRIGSRLFGREISFLGATMLGTRHRRLGSAALAAVLVVALFSISRAAAQPVGPPACAPADVGTAASITREVVPIGTPALRAFTVYATNKSNVQLSVPAGYVAEPTKVSGSESYGYLITAPKAGPFIAHFSWNQDFVNDAGDSVQCAGAGDVPLNAIVGTPLKVKSPKKTKFPASLHALSQYDDLVWKYTCKATSDPAPLTIDTRFQVSLHGQLSKRAKSFKAIIYDACDPLQVAEGVQNLGHSFKLYAGGGGNMSVGGLIYLKLGKSLTHGYIKRNHKEACLHVGITVKQGTRVLVRKKFDSSGAGAWLPGGRNTGSHCIPT